MSLSWSSAVTIHLLAAVAWIGGMMFLSSVLAPLMRGANVRGEHVVPFRSAARRFRVVVWLSLSTLVVTGPFLLRAKQIPLGVPTDWPAVLRIKIGLVGLLLLLTIAHDLYLGPRTSRLNGIPAANRTLFEGRLIVIGRWMARLSLVVAVAILAAAVVLARS
jgi:putative copper export protein